MLDLDGAYFGDGEADIRRLLATYVREDVPLAKRSMPRENATWRRSAGRGQLVLSERIIMPVAWGFLIYSTAASCYQLHFPHPQVRCCRC